MRQRFCWLKAAFYVLITTLLACYGYSDDFSGNKKLKHLALEYGDVLTSVENGENFIRTDAAANQRLSQRLSTAAIPSSTRCTTGASITLDPTFNPSSSEKQKVPTEEHGKGGVQEMIETEVTTVRVKVYKPPPEAKIPDHYIDDP